MQWVPLVVVALLILLGGGATAWWSGVRQNHTRVFWDMVSNNLSTTGVTRTTLQSSGQLSILQYTQTHFVEHPTAHALTQFKTGKNTLATEEISDKKQDLVRYQKITIVDKASVDLSPVLGKWARLKDGQTVQGQLTSGLFSQSLLDILPIGNLQPTDRRQLVALMRSQDMFQLDDATFKKATIKGREEYLYSVKIKPDVYVLVMQRFESLIGATAYKSLHASNYAKGDPIAVVISVDARSHTLAQLYEVAPQKAVVYQGFGALASDPVPRASITTTQLTSRLAQLQQ